MRHGRELVRHRWKHPKLLSTRTATPRPAPICDNARDWICQATRCTGLRCARRRVRTPRPLRMLGHCGALCAPATVWGPGVSGVMSSTRQCSRGEEVWQCEPRQRCTPSGGARGLPTAPHGRRGKYLFSRRWRARRRAPLWASVPAGQQSSRRIGRRRCPRPRPRRGAAAASSIFCGVARYLL